MSSMAPPWVRMRLSGFRAGSVAILVVSSQEPWGRNWEARFAH